MTPSSRRSSFGKQFPLFLWLVVLWMLLWGQFTVLAAFTGIIVALVVSNVFKLPPVEMSGRINLWYGLIFVVTFLGAVVAGSLQVAWQVINPKRAPGTAVIAVPLRTNDDLIMTHVGVTSSLIPGSLVVEADRDHRILYLHAIGIRSQKDVDDTREYVQRWERRIIRAVGSREQMRALRDSEARA